MTAASLVRDPEHVAVHGARIRVRSSGDPASPPVLLLHGIGRSLEDQGRVPRIMNAVFAPRWPLAALSAGPGTPGTTAPTSALPGTIWITKPIAPDPRDTA